MVLGGLWHGAGAAYLLWGIYHGALLAIHRWWTERVTPVERTAQVDAAVVSFWSRPGPLSKTILIILFFHITCIGWLLFRAGAIDPQFSQVTLVLGFLKAMFTPAISSVNPIAQGVLLLGALALFFQWKHELMDRFSTWTITAQTAAVCAALLIIAGLGIFEGSEFIYFKF